MLNNLAHQFVNIQNPTFKLFEGLNGIHNLPQAITINGTTLNPTLLYKGQDAGATWDPWNAFGDTLTRPAVSSAPTYNQGSPLFGPYDDSVKFNCGEYYTAATAVTGDFTNEDLVVELVCRFEGSVSSLLASKHNSLLDTGWSIGINATTIGLNLYDGVTLRSILSPALVPGAWYHVIFFADKSGSGIGYANGAAGTALTINMVNSISSARKFTIGSHANGTAPTSSLLSLLAIYAGAAWLDTHLQPVLALRRFNTLIGLIPQSASGTTVPVTQTRVSSANLHKLESGVLHYYLVGNHWLRQASKNDANARPTIGYQAESSRTNLFLHSNGFSAETTWIPLDAGDTFGTQLVADGDMEAVGTASWTAYNSAALTKEITTPHGGTQCLRVTRNGANNPIAGQTILTLGHTYRVCGWYRGDGAASPGVYIGSYSVLVTQGTSSTTWQYFNFIKQADGPLIGLRAITSTGVQYCEFDDLRVYEIIDVAPNKNMEAMRLVGSATDGTHGYTQTVTAAIGPGAFSVFAKKGDKNWLYLEDTPTTLLLDGDMEAAGVTSWGAVGTGTVVSKQITAPHGGIQCLRIASTTANPNQYAVQYILQYARSYRITGWARSDGIVAPRVGLRSGGLWWTGTTSTLWQYFDITCPVDTNLYQYYVYLGATTFSASGQYVEFDDVTVTAVTGVPSAYFDLANGVIGTTVGALSYIEDLGDDWYRCCLVTTLTNGAHVFKIQSALDDGDNTFAGDGSTANTYLWLAQLENVNNSVIGYMSSPSLTTVGAAGHAADILAYKADDGNLGGVGSDQRGTIACKLLMTDSIQHTSSMFTVTASVAATSNDYVGNYLAKSGTPTSCKASSYVIVGGVNQANITGLSKVSNNVLRALRTLWETNLAANYVDLGKEGATDTIVTVPTGLTKITVGTAPTTSGQPEASLLTDIRIFKRPTRK
jgi:hypothetical protein